MNRMKKINGYLSDEARKVRDKLGPFKFGEQTFSNLEQTPWFIDEEDEGLIYLGEWNPKINVIIMKLNFILKLFFITKLI
jgi:hypothetical protein